MVQNFKGCRKESILDHIYVSNLATVENINFETPTFGDHVLVMAELNFCFKEINTPTVQKRKWTKYSSESFNSLIKASLSSSIIDWKLLNVIDYNLTINVSIIYYRIQQYPVKYIYNTITLLQ